MTQKKPTKKQAALLASLPADGSWAPVAVTVGVAVMAYGLAARGLARYEWRQVSGQRGGCRQEMWMRRVGTPECRP